MPPATKKDGCFVKIRTGKETVLSLLFPLWQSQECVFVGEKSAEACCLLHTHTHTHTAVDFFATCG